MNKKKLRAILIAIGILCILFIGYHLFFEYQKDIQLFLNPKGNSKELMESVRSHGLSVAVIFILMIGIMCAVPGVPTSVIGVIVGLSYGPIIGTVINVLGNATGNIISITLMKHLKLFDQSKKSNRWVKAIHEMRHPKIGVMVGYMIPLIPSSVINFAVITLNLNIEEILFSIFLGVIPSSILYAFGGDALFRGYSKTAMLIVTSVFFLSILVVIIYKDRRKNRVE
ncbi:SNARE-like domain protein [Enterococcus casseliflavus]|nr:SNARE-like domain protein [Enterococcus casseliflavus]